jgi:cytochrome c oxidase cbb3-type subunit 3
MGAPTLTDGIWLHGWGEDAIIRAINNGFTNTMPPQSALLNEAQINVLSSYVWGLSNKSGTTQQ